nr:hypothetical protein B0A51_15545 [Rachicladosporium sp. CCFEE 5018]
MASGRHWEQDKDSTLYIGNLAEQTTDSQIWELLLQAGPIVNVHLPKDRVTQVHQGYGFVEFASEEDADYACKIMNQIRLWGKPIRVNKASADKRLGPGGVEEGGRGVGAELFVGGLDGMVDERGLFETFSRFGALMAPPKVARDESNLSKGYAFISYSSFEAADDAIANMHGQYLMNKEVSVQYAFKKDGKGERHGDAAERALAAQAKRHNIEVAIPAMPAALVLPTGTPTAPSGLGGNAPPVRPPALPAGSYGAMPPQSPYGAPPQSPYGSFAPPPQMQGYAPPPSPAGQGYAFPTRAPPLPFVPPPMMGGGQQKPFAASPLQAPPTAGLPPRPPPSAFPPPPPPGAYQNGGYGR